MFDTTYQINFLIKEHVFCLIKGYVTQTLNTDTTHTDTEIRKICKM